MSRLFPSTKSLNPIWKSGLNNREKRYLQSPEDTFFFGEGLAGNIPKDATLALYGPIGAGKTTFVQGLSQGLGVEELVQSPTFVLFNHYDRFAHFDLYRLKKAEEFFSLGFDRVLKTTICAIEWPEKIQSFLPKDTIHIRFSYEGKKRIVEVKT